MSKSKKRTVRVDVKKIDICRGERGKTMSCPIARAVRRATGWRKRVSVGADCITVDMALAAVTRQRALCGFIVRFDCGEPVVPFSFTLRY